jgi:hypothetical protein
MTLPTTQWVLPTKSTETPTAAFLRYNPADPKENNSLESELDRPWFKEYTWLVGALIVGAMLVEFVHRYFPHLFHR